jgi:hypothetical protein
MRNVNIRVKSTRNPRRLEMSKRIDQAIAAYQAATTPAVVKASLKAADREGHADLVTAYGIRMGAASVLRDALDAEIGRDPETERAKMGDALARASQAAAGTSLPDQGYE